MLIVEGPTDENLLCGLCQHGQRQVWAAGTRKLVETLLVYLGANPIEGCECVYLTDCDGRGKANHLKHKPQLIVTAGCDAEADLVSLGVAERAVRTLLEEEGRAAGLVAHALSVALPLSVIRRRAHSTSISMKRDKRMLRFTDLPTSYIDKWLLKAPSTDATLDAVAIELGWSEDVKATVCSAEPQEGSTFELHGSGKDTLDVLWLLLRRERNDHNLSRDGFHNQVRDALQNSDLADWEVGKRLRKWQADAGVELIPSC
jgi:hypothetical protein